MLLEVRRAGFPTETLGHMDFHARKRNEFVEHKAPKVSWEKESKLNHTHMQDAKKNIEKLENDVKSLQTELVNAEVQIAEMKESAVAAQIAATEDLEAAVEAKKDEADKKLVMEAVLDLAGGKGVVTLLHIATM